MSYTDEPDKRFRRGSGVAVEDPQAYYLALVGGGGGAQERSEGSRQWRRTAPSRLRPTPSAGASMAAAFRSAVADAGRRVQEARRRLAA